MSELTNQMTANTIFLGLGGIRMWTDGYEHIHVFDPEKETDTLAIPLEWQCTSAKVMISVSEYAGTTTVVYALESSQEKHPYVLLDVSTRLEAEAAKKAIETAIAKHETSTQLEPGASARAIDNAIFDEYCQDTVHVKINPRAN